MFVRAWLGRFVLPIYHACVRVGKTRGFLDDCMHVYEIKIFCLVCSSHGSFCVTHFCPGCKVTTLDAGNIGKASPVASRRCVKDKRQLRDKRFRNCSSSLFNVGAQCQKHLPIQPVSILPGSTNPTSLLIKLSQT
jgi:hypothetical protein